jgi:hypothetical protein
MYVEKKNGILNKMNKKHHPRPMLPINQNNHHHVFILDALLSSFVVTFTFFLDDIFSHYVNEKKLHEWQKYMLHAAFNFLSTLCAIYALLFIFGYRRPAH